MEIKQILTSILKQSNSYRGIDFNTHLINLINTKIFTRQTREELYKMCRAALIYCPISTLELLNSDDNEVVELGIQMLFIDYLDLFNQVIDNEKLKTEIYTYIKLLMNSLKFIKTQIAYDK